MGARPGVFCFAIVACGACYANTNVLQSLPYRFEQNRGQAPAASSFVARSSNYEVLANAAGPVFLYKAAGKKQYRLETVIRGGNRLTPITGESPEAARVNYLIGNDPAQWLHDIPNYGRVRYKDVYPSVDLVFHGSGNNFEFDFEVKPGGDPRKISLTWKGLERGGKVRLTESGDLLIATAAGDLRWARPVIYQKRGQSRIEIAGGFRVKDNIVSFEVQRYDHNAALVIDPTVSLASFVGGSGNDASAGIAVDGQGNIVVGGVTSSANLPTKSASAQPGYGGDIQGDTITGDAFVAQLNPTGTTLNWITYLGGSGDDVGYGIAADSTGNAYITGMTNSTNFPVQNAVFGQYLGAGGNVLNPMGDAFVTKLNSSGQLVYSTYFGGSQDDQGMAITADSSGNAYVTGVTLSLNLPVASHSYQKSFNGSGGQPQFCGGCGPVYLGGDAFVAKFGPTGSLVWTTYLGGSNDDSGLAIAVDKTGNVYVGGATLSTDFPVTAGSLQTKLAGISNGSEQPDIKLGDAWVAKLDPTGGTLVYGTYIGGANDDTVFGIAVDGNGDAFVTGATSSSDFPVTKGAFQTVFAGPSTAPAPRAFSPTFVYGDAFAAELNPAGTALLYSTYIGGAGDDAGQAIAVDASGNAYVVGHTTSTNFPVTSGAAQSTFGGSGGEPFAVGDMFLFELNPSGTTGLYSTYYGGAADDAAAGIVVDSSGNAWVSGYTTSPHFPVTSGAYQTTFGGTNRTGIPIGDAVVVKFTGLNAPPGPAIKNGGVVPVYSTATTIQPGSWFSIYGSNLATGNATWKGDYPTLLGGTTVTVNGKNAYLWFVAAGQINAQAPDDTTAGSVPVTVSNSLGSTTGTVTLAAASPSFLLLSDNVHVTGIIQTPNGMGSQGGGTYDLLGPTSLGAGYRPAKPGEPVAIYAVGLGATNPPVPAGGAYNCPPTGCAPLITTPQLKLGSTSIPVVFAGIVSEGLYQINLTAPTSGLGGDQAVTLTLGSGQQTQTGVLLPLQ